MHRGKGISLRAPLNQCSVVKGFLLEGTDQPGAAVCRLQARQHGRDLRQIAGHLQCYEEALLIS